MENKHWILPGNGTISWLENCKKHNYMHGGYTGNVVSEFHPTHDSRIVIMDYNQPIDAYHPSLGKTEFFTSLTFYKKEIVEKSEYKQFIYERPYTFYFPYGTRFGCRAVYYIGESLSKLIDKARLLPDSYENAEEINMIQLKQKALMDLILKGTNDKYEIFTIMQGVKLPQLTIPAVGVAKSKKDWLPYSDKYCNYHSKFAPSSQGVKSRKPIDNDFELTM